MESDMDKKEHLFKNISTKIKHCLIINLLMSYLNYASIQFNVFSNKNKIQFKNTKQLNSLSKIKANNLYLHYC